MKTFKQFFLLALCLLCMVPMMACEQPEDNPGPGPGGGGGAHLNCTDGPTPYELRQEGRMTFRYCDGCCYRAREATNQMPYSETITWAYEPGSICACHMEDPNGCSAKRDAANCSECSGGGGHLRTAAQARLVERYPDLEWAIDQGFFSTGGK